jgi:hypothetical protein
MVILQGPFDLIPITLPMKKIWSQLLGNFDASSKSLLRGYPTQLIQKIIEHEPLCGMCQNPSK